MSGPRRAPPDPPLNRDGFRIAVVCALPEERDAVEALMSRDYVGEGLRYGKAFGDENHYTLGELGDYPVILVTPPRMGITDTRTLALHLCSSFRNVDFALVVGICGSTPFKPKGSTWIDSGIRLGDVIISTHIIQWDFGREYENGFKRKTNVESSLSRAPTEVANFINAMKGGRSSAFKRVFKATNKKLETCYGPDADEYAHPGPDLDLVYDRMHRHKHHKLGVCQTCDACTEWYNEVCEGALSASCDELGCVPHRTTTNVESKIHFGAYASGNGVMKSAHRRDALVKEEGVIGFEMEGAGTWEILPTIVIKGVVDYADSHKNKRWRGYPAARAAMCAKACIEEMELADQRPSVSNG